jgi:hypothetical protein
MANRFRSLLRHDERRFKRDCVPVNFGQSLSVTVGHNIIELRTSPVMIDAHNQKWLRRTTMRRTNFVIASTLLAVGLTSVSGAWAKPGTKSNQANHGQTVSSSARSKVTGDANHGQKVSQVARYKTDAKVHTKASKQQSAASSTTLRDATRTRNAAIQSAQRTFQSRRAQILNGGDTDDLTREQRQELRDAKAQRNLAIRQAQEKFRLRVR